MERALRDQPTLILLNPGPQQTAACNWPKPCYRPTLPPAFSNEAFVKWLHADHSAIQAPLLWLTKVITRLSLDYLKSARVQRETYIGPWLPEPFVDEGEMPDSQHELDQSISLALMVLFESLSPGERASYILHDLFNYDFDEIGDILNKPAPTCRKLASRARSKIRQDVPQCFPHQDEVVEMAEAFFDAIRQGEMSGLVTLLKNNVTFYSDSGGKAAAAREVLEGNETVAVFLMKVLYPVFGNTDKHSIDIRCTWFNGVPGFVIWDHGKPVSAFGFMLEDGAISNVYVHRNPKKLSFFAKLSSCSG